eukprot:CAMPEP_0177224176 /NCGR_PEP_ID=MMETSP0367-20130122/38883_1 /TAXON_ID=447022 ORGANISM="Scrippsiella hangoei-like, Strain SHHI-4" /NCGR_SAMPLE_ID=MMETSP0367 /ASSEMBLY_ACC=CAM_ASM_000362 /LENGTH=485 /DNA_ID=CAMNT_0018674205 /DNA_START=36 /DNA_END=1493 /DNA_ORIENTATION=+
MAQAHTLSQAGKWIEGTGLKVTNTFVDFKQDAGSPMGQPTKSCPLRKQHERFTSDVDALLQPHTECSSEDESNSGDVASSLSGYTGVTTPKTDCVKSVRLADRPDSEEQWCVKQTFHFSEAGDDNDSDDEGLAMRPTKSMLASSSRMYVMPDLEEYSLRELSREDGTAAAAMACNPFENTSADCQAGLVMGRWKTLSLGSALQGLHPAFIQLAPDSFPMAQLLQQSPEPVLPERSEAAVAVWGKVWNLSQHTQVCRKVQEALDDPGSEEARNALAAELHGRVWDALRCRHANFVLQKCIATLPESSLQFIVDEILADSAEQAAKHKFGCRIVQRLVEHCPLRQVKLLVDDIVSDFSAAARHEYGNYVVQHLLEHAAPRQRSALVAAIVSELRALSADNFGAAVVASCTLARGPAEGQVELARALARQPDLLLYAACTRHGHGSVVRVLEVLRGEELEAVSALLRAQAPMLRVSKFGCLVNARVGL